MSNSMLLQPPDSGDFTLEPEDDLDAFNDETFGGAAEWEEEAHEELAQLTEQERIALQSSNDFFEFGSEDGDSLEPLQKHNGANGAATQLSQLSLEPSQQAPLSIQTSIPAPLPPSIQGGVYHQGVQPVYQLPQQVQYNLMPPSHFQAVQGVQHVQAVQTVQDPLMDPAIMSFSKPPQLPNINQVPTQYTQIQMPRGNFPTHPPVIQQQQFQHANNSFPQNNSFQPNSYPTPFPANIMGFKTIQDVEHELLYGPRPVQPVGPGFTPNRGVGHAYPPPRGHPQQQQFHQTNRNLNYPGMRDRQGHQVYNDINSQRRQENQRQLENQRYQDNINQRYQENQRYQDNSRNQSWNQRSADNMNRNRPYDNRDHRQNEEDRYDHHDRQQKRFEREEEWEEDSWRWNEVRNRARDSATRRDLMPGQVHVQGILRHSREPRLRDPEDDCLGDDAPLFEPTGDPVLDAKLSQEQAELANRCREFDETEDEYAGLMSHRDKQFIINIQLSQLKCDNPYVDDYYFTMFTAKQQQRQDPGNTAQLLLSELSESGDAETEYIPTQFQNSLGKLQVVTVKAPRQIIDVGVVRCQETSSPVDDTGAVTDPGLTVVKDQNRAQDYKGTLLQLERVYNILLELESLKLKLSAIPTGAPLREQVTLDLTRQIQILIAGLNKPSLIPQYLQVRKGRGLLSRCLKHLPGAAANKICQEMFVQLDLVCKDKTWVDHILGPLQRYIAQSSLSLLEGGVSGWSRGLSLTLILTTPLGVSTLLAVIYRAASAAKRGQEKISVSVWRELILAVLNWIKEEKEEKLGEPLVPPQPLDIGFLLTLTHNQHQAWEAFLVKVGVEVV